MSLRNGYKTALFYITAILAAVIAYQIFPVVKINGKESASFSPERVAADINIISKRPHSIQHAKERKVVKNYLFHRLEQMGGGVQTFVYDSIASKIGGCFDAENVYAVFEPEQVSDSTQYLLFVAHYDSRYRMFVLKDTVYSYGAADDGYGIGVILESLYLALQYRSEWKQGVKVLFTDAEEHSLDGMKNMAKYDNHILDNVSLVMNIEARGVKGPALLFETSKGNSEVVKLYNNARNPYAYSFTTLVYKVLPNDTDFSIVKDSIPGFNFAVIDNLKYYHTDLDNFSNISLKSIAHYGEQIEPMVKCFLTESKYSTADALRSDRDSVFFTLPLLGLFDFSRTGYIVFNILLYLLFGALLLFYMKWKNLSVREILKGVLCAFCFMVGSLAVGELVGWLAACYNGEKFDLVDVKFVKYDYAITIVSVAVLFLTTLIFIRLRERANNRFIYSYLLGSMVLMAVMSLLLFVTVLENFFLLVPLAVTSVALLFNIVKMGKFFFVLSGFIIMLLGFSFYYCVYTALTIGALGVVLMLISINLSILIAQYYCFKRNV